MINSPLPSQEKTPNPNFLPLSATKTTILTRPKPLSSPIASQISNYVKFSSQSKNVKRKNLIRISYPFPTKKEKKEHHNSNEQNCCVLN